MKQTFQLGILAAANIFITFFLQWFVLTELGPGVETDAYFAGAALPQLLLAVISGTLMHVLVPFLAGEDEVLMRRNTWGMIIAVGGLCLIAALVLAFLAPLWAPLLVPGFDEAGRALTVEIVRVQLIGMVFSAINGVQWAAHHARQRFRIVEFIPFISSMLAITILIWALPLYGVIAAAWVYVFRMAVQTLLLNIGMGRPSGPLYDRKDIALIWQRIRPLLLSSAYYKSDILVDRFLLSTAASGSLSLYYFAQQIYEAGNQLFNKAVSAPLMTRLSLLKKLDDRAGFVRLYGSRLLFVFALSTLAYLAIILSGESLLTMVVGYGSFGVENVNSLWWIMVWLGGVLVGGAAGQVGSVGFYAIGDTRTPTRLGVIAYTLYIPAKLLAFYQYGLPGLGLATSIYYMVSLLLKLLYFRFK